MDVFRRILVSGAAVLAIGLAFAVPAYAVGGNYVVDGGTRAERAQVRSALAVSRFDWSVVPGKVAIHVGRDVSSSAAPGEIWLDAKLLDSGTFAWGTVQHEYAHQVDFALFTDPVRGELNGLLHGRHWGYDVAGLSHASYGCERFASTLAWAYWPSKHNALRPRSSSAESAAMKPRKFRALMKRVLAQGNATRSS